MSGLKYKTGLVAAVSLLALAPQAFAQTAPVSAPPLAPSTGEDQLDEIVVTASRLARDGFSAPTPTTVVSVESLEQRGTVNIADALNDIPSFRASSTPASGGIGNSGAFLADLRGLGPTRTLVLMDQARLPQTTLPGQQGAIAGTTDLSIIPTALIRSAEVVTGGASAAYGSDAVAGVVNIMINDRLEGVKGTVQYGQSRYGDVEDLFVSLAGGTTFANDRGRIVAGFEYDDNQGTDDYNSERDWGRRNEGSATFASRPAGVPNIVIGENALFGRGTTGGLVLSSGPLQGLAFVQGPNGTVTTAPFARGLGNLTANTDLFTDEAVAANTAAGISNTNYQQLRPAVERLNFLAKATYDINDRLSVYFEPLVSRVTTQGILLARRDGNGAGGALTFRPDNVYLQQALTPAQLAQVPASGLSLGYLGNDFGPNRRTITKDVVRLQAGAQGTFGETWKWDAAYIYGKTTADVEIANNFINANFFNAIDAVLVGGQVVCRSAAAQAAGCVPVNILGRANPSAAASAYLFGTANGTGESELQEFSANLQGEPFSTWAGPVSVGGGIDYRVESLEITTDARSQTNGWLSGLGQPLSRVETEVTEGYLETIVPLLKDQPFARSLDFNGAVRATNYSTSGNVTTWKVGLTWKPTDDLTVRTTRSRDIRAPNLLELFTPVSATLPLPIDPRPGVAPISNNAGVTVGGNPDLQPEESLTQTFGVVYEPSFVDGLKLSVDYYDIQIDNAITSTSVQNVVNNCFIGGVYNDGPFCALITFANNDPVNGQITSVRGTTANVAEFKTRGLDFQATYRQSLSVLSDNLPGAIALNLQMTHVLDFQTSTDISGLFPNGIDRAGQTGAAFGGPAGLPDWLISTSVNYEVGRFALNGSVRYIDKSRQNNGLVGPEQDGYSATLPNSISDNTIPSVTYLDLGASYDFGVDKRRQLYFNIDNVFDKDPPNPANGTAYYDLIGRSFKVGIRFTL